MNIYAENLLFEKEFIWYKTLGYMYVENENELYCEEQYITNDINLTCF